MGKEKRGRGIVGVLWWWAEWPRGLDRPAASAMRRLDTLGLSGEAAVKAALVTAVPAVPEAVSFTRGGLEPEACRWVAQRSRLGAWAGRGPVRARTALAPEAFRRPPTVLQCACPHPPATFGDVRRGEALTADVTGLRYRQRGHGEMAVLSVSEVRLRLAAWLKQDLVTVIWSDPGLDPAVAQALWEEGWSGSDHLLVVNLFRTRGPEVEVLLHASDPVPERIRTITEVSSWIDDILGQCP